MQSAHAYQTIWTPVGSPLVVISRNVQAKLQVRVSVPVELAMRYQNPSIENAFRRLSASGVTHLLVIPLFPHYAMSSYESAVERVKEVGGKLAPGMRLQIQAPYYDQRDYVAALAESMKPYLRKEYDHLLFSFHGVPERQIRKSDPTGSVCLCSTDCCEIPNPAHATCYRAQCLATMRAVIREAAIPPEKCSFSFQSRLGRHPWLKPYTDLEFTRLAANGTRKLLVISPAFVSDCLETLEELEMRGRETFLGAGGSEFTFIPCLNEHPLWLDALQKMIEPFVKGPETKPTASLLTSLS